MATTISVRSATITDIDDIRRIAHETWHATYDGLIPERDIRAFLQSNYNPAQLERTVSAMGDGLLLADLDGMPVGYAMISRDRDGNAQLWTIYVLPSEQRRGAGTALWEAALEHARNLGLPRIVLWVLEENQPARAFYERQGAVLTDQRDIAVGDSTISELRYEMALGPALSDSTPDSGKAR